MDYLELTEKKLVDTREDFNKLLNELSKTNNDLENELIIREFFNCSIEEFENVVDQRYGDNPVDIHDDEYKEATAEAKNTLRFLQGLWDIQHVVAEMDGELYPYPFAS